MGLQPVNLQDNNGIRPLVVGIVSILFATAAVILRLYAHRITKQSYALDDLMIIVALVFAYGNTVDHIIGVVYGAIGLHTKGGRVTPGQLNVYLKNLIATIVLWASALAAVKLSLLLLYVRVFSTRKFRLAAYGVMPLVLGWWLSVFLEELLLCRPLAYNWNKSINGSCGNLPAAYLAAGILNLLSDVSVLVLPIPIVLNLHLPLRSRIALMATFCVGLLVCIISIIRIHAVRIYNLDDPTYSMWTIAVWSQLEPTLGIMCACVPFLRPILDLWTGRHHSRMDSHTRMTAHDGNSKAIHLANRSLDDKGLRTPNGSISTTTKAGGLLPPDLTGADTWCDVESCPVSSEGTIRVERSFIVNSGEV